MTNGNIPVVFFPAAPDACALYRQFIPHINIPDSIFLFRTGPIDLKEIEGCKVAMVQRSVSDDNQKAIIGLKNAGLKVVYDLDDDIWSLPGYNPGHTMFEQLGDGFTKCANEADIFTVSTLGLKTAASTGFRLGKEIMVIPNSIDFNLFRPKNLVRDDGKVVIGWGGSNTHSSDVAEAFSIIPEVLDKNPNAVMEIVGAPAQESRTIKTVSVKGVPIVRKEVRPSQISLHAQSKFRVWVPVSEFPNRFASWGWDIALAPLEPNRFNRSKSNIKMLEAAAVKIPCLVSDIKPYNEFCAFGGDDLNWLLCSSTRHWKEKLHILINEPERRKFLADKMYEVAFKFFNAKTVAENWKYCFKKVVAQ